MIIMEMFCVRAHGLWRRKGIDFTMAMIHAWLFSGYTGTHEDGMQALSRLDHKKYQEVM